MHRLAKNILSGFKTSTSISSTSLFCTSCFKIVKCLIFQSLHSSPVRVNALIAIQEVFHLKVYGNFSERQNYWSPSPDGAVCEVSAPWVVHLFCRVFLHCFVFETKTVLFNYTRFNAIQMDSKTNAACVPLKIYLFYYTMWARVCPTYFTERRFNQNRAWRIVDLVSVVNVILRSTVNTFASLFWSPNVISYDQQQQIVWLDRVRFMLRPQGSCNII